ncbi:MAG: IS1595 family transposase [Deltaproteobacteria bacterium]|nr:IS1595 family transposase [Deltaproteobacteria bacterium]MBI3389290.1 IS1595 family transposase [Deltaproteobacteria bacterium]
MEKLDAFDRQFPTDEACKQYLALKRWPDGVRCPRCNAKEKVYALKARPFHWACKNTDCGGRSGYRFSVITRTIFQDTKVPLNLWFKVGYLMLTAKKGLSSLQVRRVIFGEDSGTDWRTCWYMCHRWRAAMQGDVFRLNGVVEVDETYIGGKDRNRHKNKKSGAVRQAAGPRPYGRAIGYKKVGVIGAIARKGNVVCRVIGDTDAPTLASFVDDVVSEKVELVVTDENHAYNYVRQDMPHQTVNHGQQEYVRGIVHTNNIESFWSLLKRGIMGSFHHVSKDYLPLYLNEFSYRFNNRNNPDVFADLIATCSQ